MLQWETNGTIEPSCCEALSTVVRTKKWVDLSDRYFVMLGAGSAMGPYPLLMQLGANVIAIDLNRAPIWERCDDGRCLLRHRSNRLLQFDQDCARVVRHAPLSADGAASIVER